MHSLSSEHLQEIENLAGSERQKQEEIGKVALGSIFSGNKTVIFVEGSLHLRGPFLAGIDTVGISRQLSVLHPDS